MDMTIINDYKVDMAGQSVGDYRLCPLLYAANVISFGASRGSVFATNEASECNGHNCAWYDRMAERCAVLSVARSIGRSK